MCESSLRILDLKIAVAAEVARPAAVAAEALATTQKGAAVVAAQSGEMIRMIGAADRENVVHQEGVMTKVVTVLCALECT